MRMELKYIQHLQNLQVNMKDRYTIILQTKISIDLTDLFG